MIDSSSISFFTYSTWTITLPVTAIMHSKIQQIWIHHTIAIAMLEVIFKDRLRERPLSPHRSFCNSNRQVGRLDRRSLIEPNRATCPSFTYTNIAPSSIHTEMKKMRCGAPKALQTNWNSSDPYSFMQKVLCKRRIIAMFCLFLCCNLPNNYTPKGWICN